MSLRAICAVAVGAATLFQAGAGVAATAPTAPAVTDVDSITVVADMDVLLSVAVGGDVVKDTLVVSTPAGLKCGGARFEYETSQNRQCWVRLHRDRPTILSAQADGRYGTDWRVDWTGCTPISNGAACELKPRADAQIAALFVRLTPR